MKEAFFKEISLIPNDTIACYNSNIQFTLQSNGVDVQNVTWNIPANGARVELRAIGNLNVIVSGLDGNGCKVSDTSVLRVQNCNVQADCILFPTAFTPNSDGINDAFGALLTGCSFTNYSLAIYNLFGEKVFVSTNPSIKWNGTYNKTLGLEGAYVYVCTYTLDNNKIILKKGTVLLLR